jgi:large subunit ribosomal protein L13
MKTSVVNAQTIARNWYIVDANEMVLGRLSSKIAGMLMGKHKPAFSPNQDHGDNIIVINAAKVVVTGNKTTQKTYFRHSTQPGNARFRTFEEQMKKDPTQVIKLAVHGMLAKNALGRQMLRKLHVYAGDQHPHAAQKPMPLPA